MGLNFNGLFGKEQNKLLKEKTKYVIALTSADFTSAAPSNDSISITTLLIQDGTGGITLISPLHLPHNSRLISIKVFGSGGSNSTVDFARNLLTSAQSQYIRFDLNKNQIFPQNAFTIIDNETYSYSIRVILESGGNYVRGAIIEYEVDE